MAQIAINDITPEVAQAYLTMSATGQQQIKDMVEKLILQQTQFVKSNQSTQLIQAIKNFRVKQGLTQMQIKDLIEEGRE